MKYYTYTSISLGRLLMVAGDGHLTGLYFVGQKYYPVIQSDWVEDPDAAPFESVRTQLAEFAAGRREVFDLPLRMSGSEFQKAVWKQIAAIPFGKTIRYADIANAIGRPSASRAAGHATGRNPLSIIVPCHRVVGSNGSLTGYAGGLNRKEELLRLEKACHFEKV